MMEEPLEQQENVKNPSRREFLKLLRDAVLVGLTTACFPAIPKIITELETTPEVKFPFNTWEALSTSSHEEQEGFLNKVVVEAIHSYMEGVPTQLSEKALRAALVLIEDEDKRETVEKSFGRLQGRDGFVPTTFRRKQNPKFNKYIVSLPNIKENFKDHPASPGAILRSVLIHEIIHFDTREGNDIRLTKALQGEYWREYSDRYKSGIFENQFSTAYFHISEGFKVHFQEQTGPRAGAWSAEFWILLDEDVTEMINRHVQRNAGFPPMISEFKQHGANRLGFIFDTLGISLEEVYLFHRNSDLVGFAIRLANATDKEFNNEEEAIVNGLFILKAIEQWGGGGGPERREVWLKDLSELLGGKISGDTLDRFRS